MKNSPFCLLLLVAAGTWAQQPSRGLPPDEALAHLMAGNQRYVRHKEQHPDESLARRKELEAGQHPFAVILGCADSRVSPELLFDQGLGDLFVIRVAGNVVDDTVLAASSTKEAAEKKDLKVVAADYALDTGKVNLLDSAQP
ncbi:MAG TPA: carbonic anhydrase [Candidatus Acidoferrales bacterium]|nr:carbonic anhydrase [Candidatus Acidoferrales bacterium]